MGAQQDTTSKPAIDESDLTYHEQLGRGASGDVFRVTWKSKHLGKVEAAAKKIPILKDKVIDEQFWNEIYFLEKLQHPNIIQYYGHIVTSTHVVILTEYAAKGSLNKYLHPQIHLRPDLKIRWLLQAARGIQYLKQNKVSHSDIKSDNFVITSAGDLKICDFGISKDLSSTKLTATGRGTVRWQAPEIYTTQERSPRADIFSFGVVAWELETCEVPYEREQPKHLSGYSVEHWLRFNISEGLRPAIPENCPPVLRELMQQCWNGDRNKRPDIDEVLLRLESYKSGLHWQLRHRIQPRTIFTYCSALHWISQHQLAVGLLGCVNVCNVTTDGSQLAYTITSDEWKGKSTIGVAVSESLPCSMLVICDDSPYVYQYPCHQAEKEIKKYKIQDNQRGLRCIAANANTAVIGLTSSSTLVICSLPDFNHQTRVHTSVAPSDLSITSEYLVVGREEMLVKPLGDLSQDLCVIRPPDSFIFRCVCFGDYAREIYVGCDQGLGRGRVFKYTWDGDGDPHYVNTGCIIGGVVGLPKGISLSLEGLLAVSSLSFPSNVTVYSLG